MKALPVCLMLLSLLVAGFPTHAAEEGLKLLPETPEVGQPLLVYLDANDLEEAEWFAFSNGRALEATKDKTENYAWKGGWLKLSNPTSGTYTFVLTGKRGDAEVRLARTATVKTSAPIASNLPLEEAAPAPAPEVVPLRLLPKSPKLGEPVFVYRGVTGEAGAKCTWLVFRDGIPLDMAMTDVAKGGWLKIPHLEEGTYAIIFSSENDKTDRCAITIESHEDAAAATRAKQSDFNERRMKLSQPSMIAKPVESTVKDIIESLRKSGVSADLVQLPSLADALENVARSAMEQDWKTPQIVKETKTAWEGVVQHRRVGEWQLVERLFKDVALQFHDSEIEENETNAILALAALGSALRNHPQTPQPNSGLTSSEGSSVRQAMANDNSTAYVATAPCCRSYRLFQRR